MSNKNYAGLFDFSLKIILRVLFRAEDPEVKQMSSMSSAIHLVVGSGFKAT